MKGIFNASLEESMNLVTDDYIENAVNKDNDSQSIGVFIVLLVILGLTAGMFWVTWYNQLSN